MRCVLWCDVLPVDFDLYAPLDCPSIVVIITIMLPWTCMLLPRATLTATRLLFNRNHLLYVPS